MQRREFHARYIVYNFEDDTVDVGDTVDELRNSVIDDIDEDYRESYSEFYESLIDLGSGIYEHTVTIGNHEADFFIVISK